MYFNSSGSCAGSMPGMGEGGGAPDMSGEGSMLDMTGGGGLGAVKSWVCTGGLGLGGRYCTRGYCTRPCWFLCCRMPSLNAGPRWPELLSSNWELDGLVFKVDWESASLSPGEKCLEDPGSVLFFSIENIAKTFWVIWLSGSSDRPSPLWNLLFLGPLLTKVLLVTLFDLWTADDMLSWYIPAPLEPLKLSIPLKYEPDEASETFSGV